MNVRGAFPTGGDGGGVGGGGRRTAVSASTASVIGRTLLAFVAGVYAGVQLSTLAELRGELHLSAARGSIGTAHAAPPPSSRSGGVAVGPIIPGGREGGIARAQGEEVEDEGGVAPTNVNDGVDAGALRREIEQLRERLKAAEEENGVLRRERLQASAGGGGEGGDSDGRHHQEREQRDGRRQQRPRQQQQMGGGRQQHSTPPFTLGQGVSSVAWGAARVPKTEFHETFDYGLPASHGGRPTPGSDEVLILFGSPKTIPPDYYDHHRRQSGEAAGSVAPAMSVANATARCQSVTVVYVKDAPPSCLAVVGGGQGAYHLLRWDKRIGRAVAPRPRVADDEKKWNNEDGSAAAAAVANQNDALASSAPQVRFERNGIRGEFMSPPSKRRREVHRDRLRRYLNALDETLAELAPMLEKIHRGKTVVVMMCNMGFARLLANFVCAARARGIDLSNVLVVATDEESLRVARGLGLTGFYDAKNFEDIPSKHADRYGDATYGKIMYAKLVSVLLVNTLGYDVLFQDTDLIWYRDPMELFRNRTGPLSKYDMIFMDDGGPGWQYTPFRPNTGFYYVRYSDMTNFFLTDVLMAGDLVASTGSHQQILSALLNEHSARHGLRVKTLDWHDFPGGKEYHHEWGFIRDVAKGRRKPYIFHMHWTSNLRNKLLYMKQFGLWFLRERCTTDDGATASALLLRDGDGDAGTNISATIATECCSPEPLLSCHFRDMPSVIPCQNGSLAYNDKKKPRLWTL